MPNLDFTLNIIKKDLKAQKFLCLRLQLKVRL